MHKLKTILQNNIDNKGVRLFCILVDFHFLKRIQLPLLQLRYREVQLSTVSLCLKFLLLPFTTPQHLNFKIL